MRRDSLKLHEALQASHREVEKLQLHVRLLGEQIDALAGSLDAKEQETEQWRQQLAAVQLALADSQQAADRGTQEAGQWREKYEKLSMVMQFSP